MSHFAVYVFYKKDGRNYEELLAPYDETLEYAPYIEFTKAQAIAKVREETEDYKNTIYAKYLADPEAYEAEHNNEDHINYLREIFPKQLEWTDEECYQDKRKWYDDDMVDDEGNLLSTYNPNSKWDYYSVGGGWKNGLITKEGKATDEDYVSKIDWEKSGTPFAFITPNGVWHEKGKMGWWAIVSDEKSDSSWDEEFHKAVEKLGNDVTVTLVDCHI